MGSASATGRATASWTLSALARGALRKTVAHGLTWKWRPRSSGTRRSLTSILVDLRVALWTAQASTDWSRLCASGRSALCSTGT
jgi:hypothetical protein